MESFIKKLNGEFKDIILGEAVQYNHMISYYYGLSNNTNSDPEIRYKSKYEYLFKLDYLKSKYYNISIDIINEFNKIKNKNHKPLPSLFSDALLKSIKEDHLIDIFELSNTYDNRVDLLIKNY